MQKAKVNRNLPNFLIPFVVILNHILVHVSYSTRSMKLIALSCWVCISSSMVKRNGPKLSSSSNDSGAFFDSAIRLGLDIIQVSRWRHGRKKSKHALPFIGQWSKSRWLYNCTSFLSAMIFSRNSIRCLKVRRNGSDRHSCSLVIKTI